MAASVKSFSTGFSACSPSFSDLIICSTRSGREVGGKPEWNVVVTNNCKCPRRSIILNCKGFHSAEPVDRSIFLKQGDVCLLQMGSTLPPGASVKFSYDWDPPSIMFPRHCWCLLRAIEMEAHSLNLV